jgi:hypothetical protein
MVHAFKARYSGFANDALNEKHDFLRVKEKI